MATSSSTPLYVNIKDLPQLSVLQDGDFIVVESPDGTAIFDWENLNVTLEQVEFQPTIEALVSSTLELSASLSALETSVNTLLSGTAEGLGQVWVRKLRRSGASAPITFSGTVAAPFNYTEVNTIPTAYPSLVGISNDACSDDSASTFPTSAVLLPIGSYHVRFDADVVVRSINVMVGCDMRAHVIDSDLIHSPSYVLVNGNFTNNFVVSGSHHLWLEGYFTLCRDSQVDIALTSEDAVPTVIGYPRTIASYTSAGNVQLSAVDMVMTIKRVSETPLSDITATQTNWKA